MSKIFKVFSIVVLMVFCVSGAAYAQTSENGESKMSRRAKKQLAKQEAKDQKIQYNAKKLTQLLEAKDLVVMDDGAFRGESGMMNFFRVKGDTITFQVVGTNNVGTGIQQERSIYKKQGLLTGYQILEAEAGRPQRLFIRYNDILSFEPLRVLVYVHANRFEVRNDGGEGVYIRGKLANNKDANVLELGQNSGSLLLDQNSRDSRRSSRNRIALGRSGG